MADDPAPARSRPIQGRPVGPARAGEGKVSHCVDDAVEVVAVSLHGGWLLRGMQVEDAVQLGPAGAFEPLGRFVAVGR